jgi:hypothetical protein
MPYDPQRSHRRPRLAEDEPAPIDALLDGVDEPTSPDEHAAVDVVDELVVTDELVITDETVVLGPPTVPDLARPSSRRPAVAALVAAMVTLVLLLAWVRRRRR